MGNIDNPGGFPKPEFKNITEPSRLKNLGNTEFLDCFLASFFKKFDLLHKDPELSDDPRVPNYYKSLNERLNLTNERAHIVYEELLQEAGCRELDLASVTKLGAKMYYDETFWKWGDKMRSNPTYIREVKAINSLGDQDIRESGEVLLDYPVREACKVLNDKGYKTYWSSANIEDFESRKGDVVLDKSVAYILIDHQNLNSELKENLSLNGKNKFWGVALSHGDDGKYYGIWSEITSPGMLCSDLSNSLVRTASGLPDLNSSLK